VQSFYQQELLLSSKSVQVSLPDGVGKPCCVLPEADYTSSNPVSPSFAECDVYFYGRRYTPESTTITVIKKWKPIADGARAVKLTPRAAPRKLVAHRGAAARVGKEVTVAGVTTVFVADADIPVHIKNIVRHPPTPVSVYSAKSARIAPKRYFTLGHHHATHTFTSHPLAEFRLNSTQLGPFCCARTRH